MFRLHPELSDELKTTLPAIASNLGEVEATCADAADRLKSSISDIPLQGLAGRTCIHKSNCSKMKL